MTEPNWPLEPATMPTMYFIGVTTAQSSMMKIFPQWSEILGISAKLVGYDAPLHAPAEHYRDIVQHIKEDPLSVGGLVTTHKIDLLDASRDLFDYLDPYAQLCDEISSISKQGRQLQGHAVDPITSGLTLHTFVEPDYWQRTGGHVLCLGAGGAAVAISVYFATLAKPDERPAKLITVDLSQSRLDALRKIHAKLKTNVQFDYVLNASAADNDALMATLPPGSMVINATGMGKDRPGSPVTDQGVFPMNGLVWELNYRGALDFLHQAERQAQSRALTVKDGWVYFLYGWTQVMTHVFHLDLTPALFAQLDQAASALRG